MSRDIKFRGWDNLQKKYEYWDARNDKYDGIFWSMVKRPEFDDVEQFIRRLDKNGIKIYEGDKWLSPGGKTFLVKLGESRPYESGEVVGNIHNEVEL